MQTMKAHARCAYVAPQPADSPYATVRGVHFQGALMLVIAAYVSFGLMTVFAQTTEPAAKDAQNKSWTSTTELKTNHVNPTRVIETHTENGNRTVDTQSVQILRSGQFEPYQDIEKETVQVDATTVRTTTRTFGRDVNKQKSLVQVTEEEKHTLPSGDSTTIRLTSDTDVNGKLKPVQREITETKRTGKSTEETNTTVMLPSTNGGLAPAYKSREVRKQSAGGIIESQKTTLLPDGEGRWQTVETRKNTIRQEAHERTTEEHISRLDSAGKLGEVSRVVSEESESTSGEKRNVVETYSLEVPGTSQDGSLHLVQRTTSNERSSSSGEQATEQKVEQINRDDPNAGLRVTVLVNDTTKPGPSGVQATHTIRMRDPNGKLEVVSVDTTKSDKVATIQVEQKP